MGSAMAPLERTMLVSYRLSIMTVALSVTIRPQFAIECLRRSNRQGVGHFGPKFRVVPLGAYPSRWGCKERTSQAMVELLSKNSNLCDHNSPTSQTDGQTERQTDRRTDRRHAIAIPRFALGASRGKNYTTATNHCYQTSFLADHGRTYATSI